MAAPPSPVKWSARLVPGDVRAGEAAQVVVEAKVDAPWHIYSTKKYDMGPRPTSAEIQPGKALTAAGALIQPPPQKHVDEGFKIEVEYYEGGAAFGLPVKVAKGIRGPQKATLTVRWMACHEGQCLPPATANVPVTFTVAAGAPRPDRLKPSTAAPAQPKEYKGPAAGAATTPPPPPAGQVEAGDTRGQIEQAQKKGLLAFLGLAITMGFLALLTPCVFPMIPITVSYFAKQQELNPRAGIRGPVAYCLGIVGTFTGLGLLLSVLFGAGAISSFATNPWVNIGLALLFIAMAVNLFGGFEIVLPSWLIEKSQSGTQRSGLLGPMLMGLTFTLTSFTCTVAFVGTLLAATTQGNFLWPVVGMLGFSAAFASPFFLLALFPQWLARLPKAGSWLVTVKAFMGFLELAAALKFLSNADLVWQLGLITRPVFLSIWFGIAAITGFFLLGWLRLPHDAGGGIGPFRRVLGVMMLGASVWLLAGINGKSLGQFAGFLPPRDYGPGGRSQGVVTWIENYDHALTQAKAEGKPIFIDFTGVTCTNCRVMEDQVFTREEVEDEFRRFVTVRLYTDKEDAESNRYKDMQLQRFGQTTLPLYVILTPDEQKLGEYSFNTDARAFVHFLQNSRARAGTMARN